MLQSCPDALTLQLRLVQPHLESGPAVLTLGEQAGSRPANPPGEWGLQVSRTCPTKSDSTLLTTHATVWVSARLLSENSQDEEEVASS